MRNVQLLIIIINLLKARITIIWSQFSRSDQLLLVNALRKDLLWLASPGSRMDSSVHSQRITRKSDKVNRNHFSINAASFLPCLEADQHLVDFYPWLRWTSLQSEFGCNEVWRCQSPTLGYPMSPGVFLSVKKPRLEDYRDTWSGESWTARAYRG